MNAYIGCGELFCVSFPLELLIYSSKVMDTPVQTRILAWIDGGYVLTSPLSLFFILLLLILTYSLYVLYPGN